MCKIKLFAALSLLLSIFWLIPSITLAHILKTDGDIGAVLHIDPDDDPIAGEQTSFFFEFKDKQNKFTPQGCDCTFYIIQEGKQIFSQPLFQNNIDQGLYSASIFFTFPKKDVYQVKLTGKPILPDAFEPFSLVYDVQVARQSPSLDTNSSQTQITNTSWFNTHLPHLIGGIIVAIFLIFALIKQMIGSKASE